MRHGLVMITETLNMEITTRSNMSTTSLLNTNCSWQRDKAEILSVFRFPEKWTGCVVVILGMNHFISPPYVIKLSNIGSEAIKSSNWILGSALLSSVWAGGVASFFSRIDVVLVLNFSYSASCHKFLSDQTQAQFCHDSRALNLEKMRTPGSQENSTLKYHGPCDTSEAQSEERDVTLFAQNILTVKHFGKLKFW